MSALLRRLLVGASAPRAPQRPTLGFLHTDESHVERFTDLVADIEPDLRTVHRVEPALLSEARAQGVTPALRSRILDALRLLSTHSNAIVCSCSTLGAAVEEAAEELISPVIRIDRPMAEEAARHPGSLAVVASLESTLAPTRALLEACGAGRHAEIRLAPCLDAWPLFEAGDTAGYNRRVAEHVRAIAPATDVIVLAQASMADVEPMLAGLDACVLSSPRLAVKAAARLCCPAQGTGGAAYAARAASRASSAAA